MIKYILNIGDCSNVPTIETESVDLVITSPPYGKAKEYDIDNPNNIGNYDMEEYFTRMRDVYKETYRVLKPGAKLCLNIMDLPVIGSDNRMTYIMYGDMTKELLEETGFILAERVLWIKGRNRAPGLLGTYPYPANPILYSNWEWVFIMRKPGIHRHQVTNEEKEASKMPTGFIKDVLYSSWDIPCDTHTLWHKAPFPEELVYRLIRLYSFVGETIYDPFLGSGTTMLVAKKTGRSCIGTEIGYNLNNHPKGFTNWIDAFKDKVHWGEITSDLYGRQIIWRINDLGTGKIVEEKTSNVNRKADFINQNTRYTLEGMLSTVPDETRRVINELDTLLPKKDNPLIDINSNTPVGKMENITGKSKKKYTLDDLVEPNIKTVNNIA